MTFTADFRDNPTTLGDTDTLAAATGQTITINGGATAYAARVKAPKSEAGYLHLPGTTGNAPAVTFPTIGANDDFVLEMDVYLVDVSSLHLVSGSSLEERIIIYNSGSSFQCNVGNTIYSSAITLLTEGVSTITVERTSGTVTLKQNGVTKGTINNVLGSATFSHLSFNGQYTTGVLPLNGYIKKATLSIEGTEVFNCDFTATNIHHHRRPRQDRKEQRDILRRSRRRVRLHP